ncbi:MAG: NADH-quinone oxidoreductase subunit B family protein [Planctomycetota bacterium]|jgi:F420-non-reducing hydrogenase small subunit
MSGKIKMAVSWAAACGGCDVSLLDIEEKLLDLAEIADIVFWPVAMDFKRDELLALPAGNVDIGIFNGAVRTSEQEEDAVAFREKCKVLVAYGACACFGGIPGLANLTDGEGILETAYGTTVSTDNPDGVRPETSTPVNGHELTLPEFHDTVKSLPQVVPVDVVMPGCPPPTERILDLVDVAAKYAADGTLPPKGAVLAEDKALCDECSRNETRTGGRIAAVRRPHEVAIDPDRCFLDQGILCMGIATRGGCGQTCIRANMPCRGCFGPTPDMLDPGAEAMSAIGSVAGEAIENDVPEHEWKRAVRSIRDPAGTFYRFTLPVAILNRAVSDEPREAQP